MKNKIIFSLSLLLNTSVYCFLLTEVELAEKNPIFTVAIKGQVNALEEILQNGTDPNVKDLENTTPLAYLAMYNQPENSLKLIQYGGVSTLSFSKRHEHLAHTIMMNLSLNILKVWIPFAAEVKAVLYTESQDILSLKELCLNSIIRKHNNLILSKKMDLSLLPDDLQEDIIKKTFKLLPLEWHKKLLDGDRPHNTNTANKILSYLLHNHFETFKKLIQIAKNADFQLNNAASIQQNIAQFSEDNYTAAITSALKKALGITNQVVKHE